MKRNRLIYGTYNKKEWNRIIEIFEESGVEYSTSIHTRVFTDENGRYKDEWTFNQLEAWVSSEEEGFIKKKRNLLKKIFC